MPNQYTGRTTCKRGHDLTDKDNVYRRSDGKRECAVCRHLRNAGEMGTGQYAGKMQLALEAARLMQNAPQVAAFKAASDSGTLSALLMARLRAYKAY